MLFCSRSKTAVLVVAGFAALSLVKAVSAQETRIPQAAELTASDCTPELFATVDRDYRARPFRNSGFRAEEYIRRILGVCPSTSANPVLRRELQTLEEERAEHFFLIAAYYLGQAQKGKFGLKGA